MDDNPYVNLTKAFNEGRLRAVLSSGQAVVLHRSSRVVVARAEGIRPWAPPAGTGETS